MKWDARRQVSHAYTPLSVSLSSPPLPETKEKYQVRNAVQRMLQEAKTETGGKDGGTLPSSLQVVFNRLLKRLVCNQAYPFHIFAKTIPLLNHGQLRLKKKRERETEKQKRGIEPREEGEGEAEPIILSVINTAV